MTHKGRATRRICILCQQTSPKGWFGNMNMTSYCDVRNSAHQIKMTTICQWMNPPREHFLRTPLARSLIRSLSSSCLNGSGKSELIWNRLPPLSIAELPTYWWNSSHSIDMSLSGKSLNSGPGVSSAGLLFDGVLHRLQKFKGITRKVENIRYNKILYIL